MRGRLVVQTIDVGEQHQAVGLHHMRHQRSEPIVVAEADLVGGHCVVLVDDRQHAELQQPRERPLSVAVVGSANEVLSGEQNLADADVVAGELRGVVGQQDPLSDAGRSLLGREVPRRIPQPQSRRTRRDRTRRHQDQLHPGPHVARKGPDQFVQMFPV